MNLIDDINIQNMYKYQINEKESNEYEKYIKYLTIFLQKEVKKEKYTKEYLDGKYILIDKTNPKKRIEIKPSQFLNINILHLKLKENSDLILYKINNLIESKSNITEENRKEFEILKKEYVDFKVKLNDIENINKEYYETQEQLFSRKIDKSNQLAKYYQKRNEEYEKIEVFITETLKNKLMKYFKENKNRIPSQTIINKIGKENQIKSNEIEKWFNWIESVYHYLLTKKEIIYIKLLL
jgi:hypothetical protein